MTEMSMLGMNRKKRGPKTASTVVGLEFQADGIAMVVNHSNGRDYECIFQAADSDDASRQAALVTMVKKFHLHGASAVVAMRATEYKLMQISSPAMSAAELKASLRWRIKELIDYPSDEAVIDVFEFPESGQRSAERLLYVAVSHIPDVQSYVDIVRNSGLSLRAIDIGELMLRNLLSVVAEKEVGSVALFLSQQNGLLVFVKNSELYMARRLDIGLSSYQSSNETQRNQISEQIYLEIQRSLDYFESHFTEPLPSTLYIFPKSDLLMPLVEQMRSNLSMSVETLLLQETLNELNSPDEKTQSQCVMAAGAALKDLSEVAA